MRRGTVAVRAVLDRSGVVVACSGCGRQNRLPYSALGKVVRCGQCHDGLSAPTEPLEVADSATFDAATTTSALPVVVDFWAPWCGPCKMVAPELEKVARANAGRYVIVKVNTDNLQDVAVRFRIRSIPTLAVLHDGRELERMAGARSAADIEAFVHDAVEASQRRAS